jgi:hypothetical protein
MKGRNTISAILIAGAAMAGGAFLMSDSDGEAETETTAEAVDTSFTTAEVQRKDLVDTTELDGTLGFGDPVALPNRASGVLTWLPDAGAIIEPGDVLYMVDDEPVVYLPGDVPAYRALRDGDEGNDVHQLEEYLDTRGFMEPHSATVDGDFTSYTERAIEDWYEADFGLLEQDSIGDGMIVFGMETFRISQVTGQLGAQVNGGSVISYTDTTRLVSVQLDPEVSGLLTVDQRVAVELPDESEVTATVTFVADVVTTSGDGPQAQSWIDVELVLEGAGSAFDESPVVVSVDEAIELDAVVVPIPALLALAEGGYAVEKVIDGTPVLIAVEIGSFLSNEVSVTADLVPGDLVVVP